VQNWKKAVLSNRKKTNTVITPNITILEDLKDFLNQTKNETALRALFIESERSLVRTRKLPLEHLACLLINLLKKSYSIELESFFELLGKQESGYSKSAFCQQRHKLKSIFFACWNSVLTDSYYRHHKNHIKRWHGFRVIAVDGSTAYMVNKPEVISHFGTIHNGNKSAPMARIMSSYDVLNGITIFNEMFPICRSEQSIANSWVSHYDPDMLMLYDRGYPSFATIYLHINKELEQKFVIRCSKTFNKEVKDFVNSSRNDHVVQFKASKTAISELYKHGFIITGDTTVKVRLIKVMLKGGSKEILITNLFDTNEFPVGVFKALYFKRWGIETSYDVLKNKLQLESFTGHKVNTIMQDFYATVFIANLQEILSKSSQSKIKEQTKNRKYEYKVNRNVAIGLMKNKIVELFISHNPQSILEQLENIFLRHLEPVRPNREYQRVVKHVRLNGKYQTLTNYRRAI